MNNRSILLCLCTVCALCTCSLNGTPATTQFSAFTADHTVVHQLWNGNIPESALQNAKTLLHIGYAHTSHGSQLTDGMNGLTAFANAGNCGDNYQNSLLAINSSGAAGALHLFEGSGYDDGWLQGDAGWSGNQLYNETREFLDDSDHASFNVIMWSWCGQLSGMSASDLRQGYLEPMAQLENEYPEVTFVYMTGHLDGTGVSGTLHQRNEQIREYCRTNGKWLYDFADIESYDPEGNYYLNKAANDACDYDSNGDGSLDTNWAQGWQDEHAENEYWYACGSAHSEPLNANMKAYAAWWLFARIAGWDGTLNP